jgi:hypothetical protein
MRPSATRHGDRLEPIELVTQLLPLLPGEELLQRHRSAHGDVHDRQPSSGAPESSRTNTMLSHSLPRAALGTALLLSLAGCQIGPSLATRLRAYVGQPETALVQGLGIPNRTITSGGVKFLAYDWQSSTVIPGSPGFVGWGGFGAPGFGQWGSGWATPPVVVTTGCEATFQMTPADTVGGFTLRGNDCG